MKVKLTVLLSEDEVKEYKENYYEFNGIELPDEEVKEEFLEQFWADKHEYLCAADINCEIVK